MTSYLGNLFRAYEMFLQELDAEIAHVRDAGARALSAGDYDQAQRATDTARAVGYGSAFPPSAAAVLLPAPRLSASAPLR